MALTRVAVAVAAATPTPTNLGSLPTDFALATDCARTLGEVFKVYPTLSSFYLLQGPPEQTTCYPSGYSKAVTGTVEPYYSPALCPTGFTAACQSTNTVTGGGKTAEETVVTCCPEQAEFTCRTKASQDWEETLGCYNPQETGSTTTWTVRQVSDGNTALTTYTTSAAGGVNAYSIQVRYRQDDGLPATKTKTKTKTKTTQGQGGSTPTDNSSNQPPPGGSNSGSSHGSSSSGGGGGKKKKSKSSVASGAIAGIVIGVLVVVSLVGALLHRYLRNRRGGERDDGEDNNLGSNDKSGGDDGGDSEGRRDREGGLGGGRLSLGEEALQEHAYGYGKGAGTGKEGILGSGEESDGHSKQEQIATTASERRISEDNGHETNASDALLDNGGDGRRRSG